MTFSLYSRIWILREIFLPRNKYPLRMEFRDIFLPRNFLPANFSSSEKSILLQEGCPRNLSSKFDEFLGGRSQFYSAHRVDFYAPTCFLSATFVPPLFAFVLCFYDKNHNKFRHTLRCLRCSFRVSSIY